jgi:hypothetical protein
MMELILNCQLGHFQIVFVEENNKINFSNRLLFLNRFS